MAPTIDEVQADLAATSARASDLVAENDRLKRQFKRIEKAEELAAAAAEQREAALDRVEALEAERNALANRVDALEGEVQQLQAQARSFREIKRALKTP